jgi:hypothetical protein
MAAAGSPASTATDGSRFDALPAEVVQHVLSFLRGADLEAALEYAPLHRRATPTMLVSLALLRYTRLAEGENTFQAHWFWIRGLSGPPPYLYPYTELSLAKRYRLSSAVLAATKCGIPALSAALGAVNASVDFRKSHFFHEACALAANEVAFEGRNKMLEWCGLEQNRRDSRPQTLSRLGDRPGTLICMCNSAFVTILAAAGTHSAVFEAQWLSILDGVRTSWHRAWVGSPLEHPEGWRQDQLTSFLTGCLLAGRPLPAWAATHFKFLRKWSRSGSVVIPHLVLASLCADRPGPETLAAFPGWKLNTDALQIACARRACWALLPALLERRPAWPVMRTRPAPVASTITNLSLRAMVEAYLAKDWSDSDDTSDDD